MLKFIIVFIIVSFVDFLWARYISNISKGNALTSSIYGAMVTLIGSIITITYVHDHRMIIPNVLGAFFGTYLSFKIGNK